MEILIIINVILSAAALVGGIYMKNVSAKDTEMKTGFRTERARLSPETWHYANTTCGRSWITIGGMFLVLGTSLELAFYYFRGDDAKMMAVVYGVFFISMMINSCRMVMDGLNKKFDTNGKPIEEFEV